MSSKITSLHPQKSKATDCLQCGEKAEPPYKPFCSRRCSQLDLGKWLNEAYFIPVHELDENTDLNTLIAQAEKDTTII